MSKKNIVIFASGAGTNASNIIDESGQLDYQVKLIVTNNPDAGVINVAKNNNIPYLVISKRELLHCSSDLIDKLHSYNTDLIVLAGFLLLVPLTIVEEFENRIINIHPALLPNYGGKGMYGMNVHNAVINSGESCSGITIHYVNKEYDKGDIIFQKKLDISASDTPGSLAQKIHQLEYKYFPQVIQDLLTSS